MFISTSSLVPLSAFSLDSGAGVDMGTILSVSLMLAAGLVYILPIILAQTLNSPQPNKILLINLFLGWTVIGWFIALTMALNKQASGEHPRAEWDRLGPGHHGQ